jgi:hypothetical protein
MRYAYAILALTCAVSIHARLVVHGIQINLSNCGEKKQRVELRKNGDDNDIVAVEFNEKTGLWHSPLLAGFYLDEALVCSRLCPYSSICTKGSEGHMYVDSRRVRTMRVDLRCDAQGWKLLITSSSEISRFDYRRRGDGRHEQYGKNIGQPFEICDLDYEEGVKPALVHAGVTVPLQDIDFPFLAGQNPKYEYRLLRSAYEDAYNKALLTRQQQSSNENAYLKKKPVPPPEYILYRAQPTTER